MRPTKNPCLHQSDTFEDLMNKLLQCAAGRAFDQTDDAATEADWRRAVSEEKSAVLQQILERIAPASVFPAMRAFLSTTGLRHPEDLRRLRELLAELCQ